MGVTLAPAVPPQGSAHLCALFNTTMPNYKSKMPNSAMVTVQTVHEAWHALHLGARHRAGAWRRRGSTNAR